MGVKSKLSISIKLDDRYRAILEIAIEKMKADTSFSVVGEGKWFLAELCTYLLYSIKINSAKNHLPSPTEINFYT